MATTLRASCLIKARQSSVFAGHGNSSVSTYCTPTHWDCSIQCNSPYSFKIQYMYFPLALPLSALQNSVPSTKLSSFTKQSVNNCAGLDGGALCTFIQLKCKTHLHQKLRLHVQGHLTEYSIFTNYHTFSQRWVGDRTKEDHEISGCGVWLG